MKPIPLTNPKRGDLVLVARDASGKPETFLEVGIISSVHGSHVDLRDDGGRYFRKTKRFRDAKVNHPKAMMFLATTDIADHIDSHIHQYETLVERLRRLRTHWPGAATDGR